MIAGLSSLTWPSLIGGWLRLHTCYILSNQCAQVKPAIATHTHTHTLFACALSTYCIESMFINRNQSCGLEEVN